MPQTIIKLDQADYASTSGFASDSEVISVARNIPQTLSIRGDSTTGTLGLIGTLPFLGLSTNGQYVTWNIIKTGDEKGFRFDWWWSPSSTKTGTLTWEVKAQEFIENDVVTAGLYIAGTMSPNQTWLINAVYRHSLSFNWESTMVPVYSHNFKLTKVTGPASMTCRLLSCAISYF